MSLAAALLGTPLRCAEDVGTHSPPSMIWTASGFPPRPSATSTRACVSSTRPWRERRSQSDRANVCLVHEPRRQRCSGETGSLEPGIDYCSRGLAPPVAAGIPMWNSTAQRTWSSRGTFEMATGAASSRAVAASPGAAGTVRRTQGYDLPAVLLQTEGAAARDLLAATLAPQLPSRGLARQLDLGHLHALVQELLAPRRTLGLTRLRDGRDPWDRHPKYLASSGSAPSRPAAREKPDWRPHRPNSPSRRCRAARPPREVEVLSLWLTGARNSEIADDSFLSIPTVKTHVTHILRKLGQTGSRRSSSTSASDRRRFASRILTVGRHLHPPRRRKYTLG